MNILGYLVTLANIQSFGEPGSSLKDISIRVNECGRLFDELKNDRAFNFECFRQNSYCKVGSVGKYISRNFHDYIFNGNVDPRHEGLILTLYYTDASAPNAVVTRYTQNPAVLDNSDLLEEAPITEANSQRFFMATPGIPEEDEHAAENFMNGYWDQ